MAAEFSSAPWDAPLEAGIDSVFSALRAASLGIIMVIFEVLGSLTNTHSAGARALASGAAAGYKGAASRS